MMGAAVGCLHPRLLVLLLQEAGGLAGTGLAAAAVAGMRGAAEWAGAVAV